MNGFRKTLKSPRGWALLILVDMTFFVAWKATHGLLPELFWICNAASLLLVPALWFEWTSVVGMTLLIRVAVGEPGHLYELFTTGQIAWLTASVHILPTVAAFIYLRRTGLPRNSLYLSLGLILLLLGLSRAFTPEDLNVNLVYQRHGFIERFFPGEWSYRFAIAGLVVGLLFLGDWLLGLWFKRPIRD